MLTVIMGKYYSAVSSMIRQVINVNEIIRFKILEVYALGRPITLFL